MGRISKRFQKESCQRAHATNRAKERFNLDLSWVDLIDIKDAIQNGKAKFIKRQSNRITLWELTFKNKLMRVVYDSNRHTVVTVMRAKPKINTENSNTRPTKKIGYTCGT